MDPLENIDRVIHEKARLSIMTALVGSSAGMLFSDLKKSCNLTDGNLNRHLKVLEDAKLIIVRRQGSGRNSQSRMRLTANGKREFDAYLTSLELIVEAARAAARSVDSRNPVPQPGTAAG